jgi:hypothetical protein
LELNFKVEEIIKEFNKIRGFKAVYLDKRNFYIFSINSKEGDFLFLEKKILSLLNLNLLKENIEKLKKGLSLRFNYNKKTEKWRILK